MVWVSIPKLRIICQAFEQECVGAWVELELMDVVEHVEPQNTK